MTKWITLTQAAAKYDMDTRNIKNWGQKGAITVARIGETWMVDDDSITSYLEKAKTLECLKEELISLKKEYAAQIAHCIETNDERLFLLRSLKEITPLFRVVINELAGVIKEEERRNIFISVSNGEPVLSLAERMGKTYDEVARIYEKTIKEVKRKCGGMRKWYDEKAELIKELRQTKAQLENLEKYFRQQEEKEKKMEEEASGSSAEVFKWRKICNANNDVLSVRVRDVSEFGIIVQNVLCSIKINTIEDLLLLIKESGMKALMWQKGFGKVSLCKTRNQLIKMGLLNRKGEVIHPSFLDMEKEQGTEENTAENR